MNDYYCHPSLKTPQRKSRRMRLWGGGCCDAMILSSQGIPSFQTSPPPPTNPILPCFLSKLLDAEEYYVISLFDYSWLPYPWTCSSLSSSVSLGRENGALDAEKKEKAEKGKIQFPFIRFFLLKLLVVVVVVSSLCNLLTNSPSLGSLSLVFFRTLGGLWLIKPDSALSLCKSKRRREKEGRRTDEDGKEPNIDDHPSQP